jgi:hypothetical protein
MLSRKVQGAGGVGGAVGAPSFQLPIIAPYNSINAGFEVGENFLYGVELDLDNAAELLADSTYKLVSVDISSGSPGAKKTLLSASNISATFFPWAANPRGLHSLQLTTGEEAVGLFYTKSTDQYFLGIASPSVTGTYGLYLGSGYTAVNNYPCMATSGQWLAYVSSGGTVTAKRYKNDFGSIAQDFSITRSTRTVSGFANIASLAIDDTGTYAYVTGTVSYSPVLFRTVVVNLVTNAQTSYDYPHTVFWGYITSRLEGDKFYVDSNQIAYVLDASTPGSLSFIGSATYPSVSYALASGNKVYVTPRTDNAYEVFDLLTGSSDGIVPATPDGDWLGTFVNTPADVRGLYVFMSEYNTTKIFDASDLNNLSLVGSVGYASIRIEEIITSADGNTLYAFELDATNGQLTLAKYDVTNKASPVLLGRTADLTVTEGVLNYFVGKPALDGNYLYVSLGLSGAQDTKFFVFDVSGNTPIISGSVIYPLTYLQASVLLKYGNSVFVFGHRYHWEVDVTNPAAPTSAATGSLESSTVLLEGDYLYSVSASSGTGYGLLIFEVYSLAGRTQGQALIPVGSVSTGYTLSGANIPMSFCATKVGNEVFITLPSTSGAMLRFNVANPAAPTMVYSSVELFDNEGDPIGFAPYRLSAYNTAFVAKTFLVHPDGETFTTLGGYGFGGAVWNRNTGVVDTSVVDTGSIGIEPRVFKNSTKLVTVSKSGRISIGDL